jgi:hypothetical protein
MTVHHILIPLKRAGEKDEGMILTVKVRIWELPITPTSILLARV